MIIDADAHVVETVHTWDYLEGSDKKYRPQLFRSEDNPSTQYWFLDGKSIGFRNPTLSEQELLALSKRPDGRCKRTRMPGSCATSSCACNIWTGSVSTCRFSSIPCG